MNNSYKNIPVEEKEAIVQDYKNGDNIDVIGSKYHHKYETIAKILDEYNVDHSLTGSSHMHNDKVHLTQEEKDTVIRLYSEEQRGLMYSIKAIGHNDMNLARKILREAGIPLRNLSDAAAISNENRRIYNLNDHYFSEESSNMAYLLGLLASDGYVSKKTNRIKITLSSIDESFLQIIADEIHYEKGIKTFINSKGYECTTLEFASKQIKEDLAKYNIVPQKTFTYTFPTNLDRKYWIDFIRGYFDGDGSVSTSGKNAIKWQICSATPDVLQHIVDFFFDEYDIPKVKVYHDKNHGKTGIYNICYSINSTKKIYEILYTPGSLYLPRKKEKYTTIIDN